LFVIGHSTIKLNCQLIFVNRIVDLGFNINDTLKYINVNNDILSLWTLKWLHCCQLIVVHIDNLFLLKVPVKAILKQNSKHIINVTYRRCPMKLTYVQNGYFLGSEKNM